MQQWGCGGSTPGSKCVNHCPESIVLNGVKKTQKPTWSAATNEAGAPVRYDCCVLPEFEARDGECVPTCAYLLGPRSFRCKKTCCPPGSLCQAGKCVGKCSPGYRACAYLTHTCCATNWKCCGQGNCCAPTESCCGDGCCPKGKFCCDGGGNATDCCEDDEYCQFYVPSTITSKAQVIGLPKRVKCVSKCPEANRCGDQCCGRGYRCARSGPKKGKCVLNLPA